MKLATWAGGGAVLWLVLSSACAGNTHPSGENPGIHEGGVGSTGDGAAPTTAPESGTGPEGEQSVSDAAADTADAPEATETTPDVTMVSMPLARWTTPGIPSCPANAAMPPAPSAKVDAAAMADDGRIYTLQETGGDAGGPFGLELLDVASGTWSSLDGPNIVGITSVAMAYLNSKVYIFADGTLWALDLAKRTWTTGAPGPAGQSGTNLAVIGGTLYAAGGVVQGSTASAYDVVGDRWSESAQAPFFWQGIGVAGGADGRLYVLGTKNAAYDPKTNAWSLVPDQDDPRDQQAAVALASQIYTFGGFNPTSDPNPEKYEVQILDLPTLTWSLGPRMPFVVGYEPVGVLGCDGRFYVFGGAPGLQRFDPASGRWDYSTTAGPSSGGGD